MPDTCVACGDIRESLPLRYFINHGFEPMCKRCINFYCNDNGPSYNNCITRVRVVKKKIETDLIVLK